MGDETAVLDLPPVRGHDLPDLVERLQPHCGPMTDPEGEQALEGGYAWAVEPQGPLLFFADVDDHTDGEGWRVLTLVAGEGVFVQGRHRVSLAAGQSLLFDDRLEHGFGVPTLETVCYAVTAPVGPTCPAWPDAEAALRQAVDRHYPAPMASESPSLPRRRPKR